MPNFDHLTLPLVRRGVPRWPGGGSNEVPQETLDCRADRIGHGERLRAGALNVAQAWSERLARREVIQAPPIPKGVALLLRVEPDFEPDYLLSFGFEIVSEDDEGYVVVATEDADMPGLMNRIRQFQAGSQAGGSCARVYEVIQDETETGRLSRILSSELAELWPAIEDGDYYIVDIGIECAGTFKLPDPPKRKDNESDEHLTSREARWQRNCNNVYDQWDRLRIQRETSLEVFIEGYDGKIMSVIDDASEASPFPDSFSCRVEICGRGLRDLAMNHPYVFELSLAETIGHLLESSDFNGIVDAIAEIEAPSPNAPRVCVIDSGIQEGHQYLAAAIDLGGSYSYVPQDPDTHDRVPGGGHGTRVAGAVLYPDRVPRTGRVQPLCWIQNARVLNDRNLMDRRLFPPELLRVIVERYYSGYGTRIYNHSIAANTPCRLKRMSAWAAEIDALSYLKNVLFIQAAGNIPESSAVTAAPGICEHISAGRMYPEYLLAQSSRVANPAQSLQALTVGSVAVGELRTPDSWSFGARGWPSGLSRTGQGLWGVTKPDVVEYGGSLATNGAIPPSFTVPPEVCPELVRRSPPGPAYSQDDVGTSYAAPKVTHVAAAVQTALPEEPCLLYRALVAQSARWPDWPPCNDPTRFGEVLRYLGYGIPDVARATENTPFRVTLITSGLVEIAAGEAHVYKVTIPDTIRTVVGDYNVRVEVTLSYAALPKRTRKGLKGYLSTWLEWRSSNLGETQESFASRILVGPRFPTDGDDGFPWVIHRDVRYGQAHGASRTSGTLQKDWATVKSHELPPDFCVAVIGHQGWDRSRTAKARYALAVSIEATDGNIEIYGPIQAIIQTEIQQAIEIPLP